MLVFVNWKTCLELDLSLINQFSIERYTSIGRTGYAFCNIRKRELLGFCFHLVKGGRLRSLGHLFACFLVCFLTGREKLKGTNIPSCCFGVFSNSVFS